jgi:hypothetical protein
MKKKLLLFAFISSALLAEAGPNTTVYTFSGITSGNIAAINPAIPASGNISTYTLNSVSVPAVDYTSNPASVVMTVDLFSTPSNIQLQYKNSAAKAGMLIFGPDYFQTGGSKVMLQLSNVTIGTKIILNVSAKGSTAATFSATGADASGSNPATITSITTFSDIVFTATAATVVISETTGGYRMKSVTLTTDPLITSFNVNTLAAAISQTAATITATLPFGTDLTALQPTIVLAGVGATVNPTSVSPVDFSSSITTPVPFTVSDGTNTKIYAATIKDGQNLNVSSFTVNGIAATIDPVALTIKAVLPFESALTAIQPVIVLTGTTTVSPVSGVATNFTTSGTTPVNYTVTDGTYSKVFKVSLTVGPSLDITSFTVNGFAASIDPVALTIYGSLPIGSDLTALQPVIVLAGTGTTVNPASGSTTDFSNSNGSPVNFTVTDGTYSKVFAVTIVDGATSIPQTSINGVSFDGKTIQNASNINLQVFDTTGRLVLSSAKNINMSFFARGIYIVKSSTGTLKIAL